LNAKFLDVGPRYFLENLVAELPASTLQCIGLAICLGELGLGLCLLMPFRCVQSTAASLLIGMHCGIMCIMWHKGWGDYIIPANISCICCLYTLVRKDRLDGKSQDEALPILQAQPDATTRAHEIKHVGGVVRRLTSICAYASFAVFHVLGPSSYVFSVWPSWPDNAGMAFSLYSFNEPEARLLSPTHTLSAWLPRGFEDGGQWSPRATSSYLAVAEWYAGSLHQPINVEIVPKQPVSPLGKLGLEFGDRSQLHAYFCEPRCSPIRAR